MLDDVKAVARGWRWGRRPLPPLSAGVETTPPGPFPTGWARSPAVSALRSGVQRFGLKPLLYSQTSVRVAGLDSLDGVEGPVVFVANHASHVDAPLILCSLPPRWRARAAVIAAADYFFDVWWRALGTAIVFNTVPIERRARAASGVLGDLVKEGWSLVIFPEGTRTQDGWAQGFKGGAALVCVRHGIPAVPIGISGSYAAMPRGRRWPKPGRPPLSIRYGPPLRPKGDARTFNALLERAVARLLAEDETTWWDSIRSEPELPTGPDAARWRRIWEASGPR